MTLKIDYSSDLHVDIWESKSHELINPYLRWDKIKNSDSNILVIAGDISNSVECTIKTLAQASFHYEHVFFVDGNHEHYDGDAEVYDNMTFLESESAKLNNVHYLRGRNYVVVEDTAFVGVTGWYDWKAGSEKGINEIRARIVWRKYSNDSNYPIFGDLEGPANLASIQAFDLKMAVQEIDKNPDIKNVVVVTHMCPRFDLLEWRENDFIENMLLPSYCNEQLNQILTVDKNKKIKHWVYGHTHDRKVTEIDGITYHNNARGYPGEYPYFTVKQFEV